MFKISSSSISATNEADILKGHWSNWKKSHMETNSIFFPIFKDFETKHLPYLTGNACRLYLLLGLKARREGHSWYSIGEMANVLNASSRSVDNWLRELEDRGLITRHHHGRSKTTYLVPYSLNVIKMELPIDSKQPDKLLKLLELSKSEKLAVGPVYRVLHLFQWLDVNNVKANQAIVLIAKKQFKNGFPLYTAYVTAETTNHSTHIIDNDFVDKPFFFDSWVKLEKHKTFGLALSDCNCKGSKKNEPDNSIVKQFGLMTALTELCEIEEHQISSFEKTQLVLSPNIES